MSTADVVVMYVVDEKNMMVGRMLAFTKRRKILGIITTMTLIEFVDSLLVYFHYLVHFED